ncbi:MAG: [protein-PII] uridylyltransferase [Pseudomonadota bacterium]
MAKRSRTIHRPQSHRQPCRPREIVSRRDLREQIDEAVGRYSKPQDSRGEVLAILKRTQESGRQEIKNRLEAGGYGTETAAEGSYLADQIVRSIFDHVTENIYPLANPSKGEVLSLVAIGGYGRGELAPFSDIDLLFLLPYKMTPRTEQVVEEILYFLWDLKFKVGHAARSVEDCLRLAKADQVICTTLLEARWLWGDQDLYQELKHRFRHDVQAPTWSKTPAIQFIEAKLEEREKRHQRLGDSRYSLEPNIKDGKGGLRDLQSLFWIAKFIYNVDDIAKLVAQGVFTRKEVLKFEKAQRFLWTLRCHLHFLTGRGEERLTFDQQVAIAPLLGYKSRAGIRDVERLMKHYFLVAKDVGDLTRIFCAALEAEQLRRVSFQIPMLRHRRKAGGFPIEGNRLTVKSDEAFAAYPIEMLRIFQVAQKNGLDIHPDALRWITQHLKGIDGTLREDPKANEIFVDILTSRQNAELTLRRLNEAGVFGRFVPDFGRVVAQMQYNMYHHFTVDEHTIQAIGILHAIEDGKLSEEAPIASTVVHKLISRRVLYVALLLHDIAKGRRGDHSVVGAEIAMTLCPRLGLSEAETETVAWLVRHHLAMSDTAFKRDIDDPKAIRDFADLVQSPERLRLLLVLTVADIRAVGPNVWNAWKASLLRELYWRCDELLSGTVSEERPDARVRRAKEVLRARLSAWPEDTIELHLDQAPASYWLSCDTETQIRHAHLMRDADQRAAPLAIETRVDDYLQATEVTVYANDHPGLFSQIAGAVAVVGATIDAARIFTLKNGKALDSFIIEDAAGGPFDRSTKLAKLSAAIEKGITGRLRPLQELDRRKSAYYSRFGVFKVTPRVLIDNRASADHTVIEVNGRDRAGLLYEVTQILTDLNLTIQSALVSTYGERAVDVFYVRDRKGLKIESKSKLKLMEERLIAALAGNKMMFGPEAEGLANQVSGRLLPTRSDRSQAEKTLN